MTEASVVSARDLTSGRDITIITDDIYCKSLDEFGIPSPTPHCPHDEGDNGGGDDGGGGEENNPPVITLNGDSPMFLTVGDAFIDPEAMAADVEDGDLTSEIIVSTACSASGF